MTAQHTAHRRARTEHRGETFRAFFIAVLIALGVRTFVVEPFKIPSASMVPTLLVGDYILVNKFAYGVRMPVTGKILIPVGAPTRGDVVVFRYPDDPSIDYIKRVIGIPGDTVRVAGNEVWVNDTQLDHQLQSDYAHMNYDVDREEMKTRYIERNVEGDEYTIIHNVGIPLWKASESQEWTVPEGQYFMMGDHRDNSRDSRKWRNSFVTTDQLKGRAFLVHWSWVLGGEQSSDNFIVDLVQTLWKIVTFEVEEIRWNRIGRSIDGIADP